MYHKLKDVLIPEAATRDVIEKVVIKNFAIFTGKHLCWSLFLKETPIKVFSCEYCEIFKNTYFEKNLRTTASAIPAWLVSAYSSIVSLQGPL